MAVDPSRPSLTWLDVNREMIRLGAAWVYREYNTDKSLLDNEAEARTAKLGLWALPEAEQQPPWGVAAEVTVG